MDATLELAIACQRHLRQFQLRYIVMREHTPGPTLANSATKGFPHEHDYLYLAMSTVE